MVCTCFYVFKHIVDNVLAVYNIGKTSKINGKLINHLNFKYCEL